MAPTKSKPEAKSESTRERTRTNRVLLALTDEEYAKLVESAKAMGLQTGTYARLVLFRSMDKPVTV